MDFFCSRITSLKKYFKAVYELLPVAIITNTNILIETKKCFFFQLNL